MSSIEDEDTMELRRSADTIGTRADRRRRRPLRNIAVAFGRLIAEGWTFVAYVGGLVLVAVGAYLIDESAGYIVGGIALVATAILYELRAAE